MQSLLTHICKGADWPATFTLSTPYVMSGEHIYVNMLPGIPWAFVCAGRATMQLQIPSLIPLPRIDKRKVPRSIAFSGILIAYPLRLLTFFLKTTGRAVQTTVMVVQSWIQHV